MAIIYESNDEPPYDKNGKVIPVIGKRPRTIPIFQTCWKIKSPKMPAVKYLSRLFCDLNPILINIYQKHI